jgi:hypothetical protein
MTTERLLLIDPRINRNLYYLRLTRAASVNAVTYHNFAHHHYNFVRHKNLIGATRQWKLEETGNMFDPRYGVYTIIC